MRVAFAAGFFAPVEIRVKVSFPTPLTNRRFNRRHSTHRKPAVLFRLGESSRCVLCLWLHDHYSGHLAEVSVLSGAIQERGQCRACYRCAHLGDGPVNNRTPKGGCETSTEDFTVYFAVEHNSMTGDSRFVNPGALKRREWVRLSDERVWVPRRMEDPDSIY